MASANIRDQIRSKEQQELLIAELNHRVRNILNLIKSLIAQSADGQSDIVSFTNVIGGRVHALARAHDQITRENWSPASLHALIQTETAAYLGAKRDRVVMVGPDAMLHPHAYSTVALVIHELLTNSAKYGALADSTGTVTVTLERQSDGQLQIGWQETGGPPVARPTRRGFGTTIIERSIPYELNGTSEIDYDPAGVRASFLLPSESIDRFANRRVEHVAETPPAAVPAVQMGKVLIVEDNMIIALDAESYLVDLGAEAVVTTSSNGQAIRAMEETVFDFALLDVNLGMETSTPVASRLARDGIPFVFATGYGEIRDLTELFPGVPVVQKPYDRDTLVRAIAKI
jgi:two-component sensor histidine kinase/CheY-like chemotaxis protein